MYLALRLQQDIVNFFAEAYGITQDSAKKLTVEPCRNDGHGDLATNAAMVLAKTAGKPPRELAHELCAFLLSKPHVSRAEPAGPGFVNVTLDAHAWHEELKRLLANPDAYGRLSKGSGERVNIEFVSANPTGPLHAGHGRNAVLGDTLASLMERAGYSVEREYYINDAGGQIAALARSVHLRYRGLCGENVTDADFGEDMYVGGYIIEAAQRLLDDEGRKWLGLPESEWLEYISRRAVAEMMENVRTDLKALGVVMDKYVSEKSLVEAGAVDSAVKLLESFGEVYTGVLPKPKGHDTDGWEERPQLLFRATQHGDDCDRALQKSDGGWTYFAGDAAYHAHKVSRGYQNIITVLGADHIGYIKRLSALVHGLAPQVKFQVRGCQFVNFLDNGQPVRMSKRAGTFITLRDVIDRVGKDATRFMMVSRHQDMPIDFDFAQVVAQTRENPIFYIQYAHARICSVKRHAVQLGTLPPADLSLLDDPAQLKMMQILADWPRQIDMASTHLEPHRIASYLYDAAAAFHSLWNMGKDKKTLRFLDEHDLNGTAARLALLDGVAAVLRDGLALLGIQPMEELH